MISRNYGVSHLRPGEDRPPAGRQALPRWRLWAAVAIGAGLWAAILGGLWWLL